MAPVMMVFRVVCSIWAKMCIALVMPAAGQSVLQRGFQCAKLGAVVTLGAEAELVPQVSGCKRVGFCTHDPAQRTLRRNVLGQAHDYAIADALWFHQDAAMLVLPLSRQSGKYASLKVKVLVKEVIPIREKVTDAS